MPDGVDEGWAIDPDGEQGSNGRRRYDMAILSNFEPKDAFPMTAETFLQRHGDKPVRMNHDTVVSVRDLIGNVSVETFETKTAFHSAVGDAIREGNYWTYHANASD